MQSIMRNFKNTDKGFTLVEMLIAVTLFILVAFISIGAILSIFDANNKARSSKTIVDNLNFSIEDMVRTIRFGSNYHCGNTGSLSNPYNCSNGDTSIAVTFYDKNLARNVIITYKWDGTTKTIMRSYDGVEDDEGITSPETIIEYLRFYVFGAENTDSIQPYVVAVVKGYSGNKPATQTNFFIETMMSQRTLDL